MKKHLGILLLSCISSALFAQKVSIVEVGVGGQSMLFRHRLSSQQELQGLLPNSQILLNDLNNDYKQHNNFIQGSSFVNVWMGLQLGEKNNRHRPTLRLGLTLGTHYVEMGNFSTGERLFTLDTLRSVSGNGDAFVDSVNTRRINVGYEHENIGIQAAYIYYWNAEARWTVYAGIGAGFSTAFNSNYRIYQWQYTTERITHEGNTYYNYPKSEHQMLGEERFDAGTGFLGNVFIPLGLDFRIGKNPENFWGHTHFFTEFNPNLLFHNIPGLRNSFSTSMMQTIGFRVTF